MPALYDILFYNKSEKKKAAGTMRCHSDNPSNSCRCYLINSVFRLFQLSKFHTGCLFVFTSEKPAIKGFSPLLRNRIRNISRTERGFVH